MKKKIIWTLQLMPQVPHWTSASYAHTLHLYVNMFVIHLVFVCCMKQSIYISQIW